MSAKSSINGNEDCKAADWRLCGDEQQESIDYKSWYRCVDLVFEIMVEVANGSGWKDAFMKVMPQRKGAKGKDDVEGEDGEEQGDEKVDDDVEVEEEDVYGFIEGTE